MFAEAANIISKSIRANAHNTEKKSYNSSPTNSLPALSLLIQVMGLSQNKIHFPIILFVEGIV